MKDNLTFLSKQLMIYISKPMAILFELDILRFGFFQAENRRDYF